MTHDAPAFEAVLYPNQSLPAQSYRLLIASVLLVSLAVAIAFFLAGAWPVSGIMGVEILLFVAAFAWARRATRQRQMIRLDRLGLHVQAVDPAGRARLWRFEPLWTRVHMDDPPRRESRLVITSRGESLTVGQFLTPDEKLDLARALRNALRDHRSFSATAISASESLTGFRRSPVCPRDLLPAFTRK